MGTFWNVMLFLAIINVVFIVLCFIALTPYVISDVIFNYDIAKRSDFWKGFYDVLEKAILIGVTCLLFTFIPVGLKVSALIDEKERKEVYDAKIEDDKVILENDNKTIIVNFKED